MANRTMALTALAAAARAACTCLRTRQLRVEGTGRGRSAGLPSLSCMSEGDYIMHARTLVRAGVGGF